MQRQFLIDWGHEHGLSDNWALAQLDSLLYAQFLSDLLTEYPRATTSAELSQQLLLAPENIWHEQDELINWLNQLA